MTEAVKKQERIFKKLFIFLSAILALVFLTAIFPIPNMKFECSKSFPVKVTPFRLMCNAEEAAAPSGCIFRDNIITDRLFG